MGYTGFHAAAPTDIGEEINLAECLYIACKMRFGSRSTRMIRTDPARVFEMMVYHRCLATCSFDKSSEWKVFFGIYGRKTLGHRRPTNDEIVTPSHEQWPEFRERLAAEMMRPDFDFWYAPQRFATPSGVTSDFWPLCSAQLLGEMGFAIAESLAVFAVFHNWSDADIRDMEGHWGRVVPDPRRPVFDRVDHHG